MPAPLDVNREAVRVLAIAVGVREAARQMDLPEATVQAWSAREGWFTPTVLPPTMRGATVATKASDALLNTLAEDDRETRISLSRTARKLAKDSETATLKEAGDVLQVGKLAALTHNWQGAAQSNVRIAIFTAGDQAPVVDI